MHMCCTKYKIYIPHAYKVQELAVRQLCHHAYVNRNSVEELGRLVVDESHICANSDGHLFASTNDLCNQQELGQWSSCMC
jgi:hypothetical protein